MKDVALLEHCPWKLDFHLQLLLQVLQGTSENFSSKYFYPTCLADTNHFFLLIK